MALPDSRDETLVDGGPFPFTLGNSLQDQIIAGKHGEIIVQHGLDHFVGFFDATAWLIVVDIDGDAFALTAGNVVCHFPAAFPIGTVLRAVTVFFDHNAGAAPELKLRSHDWVTNTRTEIVAWGSDSGSGAGHDALTISGVDQVITANLNFKAIFDAKTLNNVFGVQWTIAKLT